METSPDIEKRANCQNGLTGLRALNKKPIIPPPEYCKHAQRMRSTVMSVLLQQSMKTAPASRTFLRITKL
ncbi:hypothetical protein GOB83_00335 [Acetobacter fabarum]|uniref:hypothetical protein n=1 Tax=Acetobacter fabarum TaxID=483199 RepID=UPI001404F1D5|nr:hypothetical protein [Acetobacter fabarum]NHO40652.1 hypothetical protein [Acetobacter fabarum]